MESPFAEIEQQLSSNLSGALRVFGVRRCGNHAIINWLIRNSGSGSYVFLNSCTNGRSAVQTCGASEVDGKFHGNKYRLAKVIKAEILEPKAKPFLLVSYEAGLQPSHLDTGNQTLGIADAVFDKEIMVTRSMSNWLASFVVLLSLMNRSRVALSIENSADMVAEISVYKAHLKAVKQYGQKDRFVHISFDNWFDNADYRLGKLAEIGLELIDNSMGKIQRYGGGSSFSTQKDPAGMPIDRRWESLGEPQFLHVIRLALLDTELTDLLAEFYPQDIGIFKNLTSQPNNVGHDFI